MQTRFFFQIVVVCLLLAITSRAELAAQQPATPKVDFARDVYPILQRTCFDCHGSQKQQGRLRLDTREAAFKGGSGGSAIVPGYPDDSELYRRVALPKGDAEIMPARGEPLTERQVKILHDWIKQGATWPDDVKPTQHWSYVKPVRPALPAVKNDQWAKLPLDKYILARLEREGLQPSPPADKAVLARRASLDLIGLPPSVAEVDAFLADDSPDAFARYVDRLLASPQFGPRWAAPWLDLARYADSHGFQRDDLRDLWAYRDWVIAALNSDMPFDQFTIEQIAGDLLPAATEAQRIATGFHRCSTTNVEAGSEPEETRINQVIDRVNTTVAVWLGTTLECAQCHDHKYDPFTQQDYYQLLAFFNNTALEADRANPKVPGSIKFLGPSMPLGSMPDSVERDRLAKQVAELKQRVAVRRAELSKDIAEWEAGLSSRAAESRQTQVLDVTEFASAAGSPHKILDDKSVLLVDETPDKDTYTVTVRTEMQGITGFKLEALTDPSLPGTGPGRGDAQRPNFVLTHFTVTAAPIGNDADEHPVRLTAGKASYAQKNFDAANALDNNARSGWAVHPRFFEPHWAEFNCDKPVGHKDGTELTFTLVQDYGAGRMIGRLRLSALTGSPTGATLPAELVTLVQTPREKRTPAQNNRVLDLRLEMDEDSSDLRDDLSEAEKSLAAKKVPTTLVMREIDEPRSSTIFLRGDYRTPGAPVHAAAPAALHALPSGPTNRLALAQWLVSPDNPLVARVTVNRWWAELFGQGLVSTVEDFGIKGEAPTHPELLDWLAVEFMENGWAMKHVLRTIVLSNAYQQSSRVTPELYARDDRNRLIARGARFRLDAERIRDNALAAAGLISLKQSGPPIRPYQPDGLWTKVGGEKVEYIVSPGEEKHRRGIYVVWKRGSPYPSFINFDAGSRLACTVKRSRSNTPLQALTLLNDPVYVEAALALAARVLEDKPHSTADERLQHAFRLCVSRPPKETELQVLRKLYEQELTAAPANSKAAPKFLATAHKPNGMTPHEFAAWYAVAATLLNLDETITRN